MKTYFITSNVNFNCIIKAPDKETAVNFGKLISQDRFGFVVDGIEAELCDDFLKDYQFYIIDMEVKYE